jgi:hypothetical protein
MFFASPMIFPSGQPFNFKIFPVINSVFIVLFLFIVHCVAPYCQTISIPKSSDKMQGVQFSEARRTILNYE